MEEIPPPTLPLSCYIFLSLAMKSFSRVLLLLGRWLVLRSTPLAFKPSIAPTWFVSRIVAATNTLSTGHIALEWDELPWRARPPSFLQRMSSIWSQRPTSSCSAGRIKQLQDVPFFLIPSQFKPLYATFCASIDDTTTFNWSTHQKLECRRRRRQRQRKYLFGQRWRHTTQ